MEVFTSKRFKKMARTDLSLPYISIQKSSSCRLELVEVGYSQFDVLFFLR